MTKLSLVVLLVCVVVAFAHSNVKKLKAQQRDINNPEYGDLYQGDIMRDAGDEELFKNVGPLNAVWDKSYLWPDNKIAYVIRAGDYSAAEINLIEEGIRDLVNSTSVNGQVCLNVTPRTNEAFYIEVYRGGGCSSYIGWRAQARQQLSLSGSCVTRHGTIMHEFLHAAGFYHEHTRGDRNDYVTINWENIQPDRDNNFEMQIEGVTVDHLGTPYEYGSVLHYSGFGFAIDTSVPTIIPHNDSAWDVMGQRTQLAEVDIERVKILYGCTSAAESKYHKHLA
eukprot:GHVU01048946.1.p1 GENE.GHVU01048946.1~~GHVU01048946.1.p1  ORF type:complete len:280 (+),score=37.23 GHVU01048946.1:30-869(+)